MRQLPRGSHRGHPEVWPGPLQGQLGRCGCVPWLVSAWREGRTQPVGAQLRFLACAGMGPSGWSTFTGQKLSVLRGSDRVSQVSGCWYARPPHVQLPASASGVTRGWIG